MDTQTITQQVRWQDLKVRNEIDVVLEIAEKEGWKDCEVFGHGDMIAQPQDLKGWKLIPADLYKYSIPREAVGRLYQIINAGVRVQGVIIADDERRTKPTSEPTPTHAPTPTPEVKPTPTPARPKASLPSTRKIAPLIGRALFGFICVAGAVALIAYSLTHLWLLIPIGMIALLGAGTGTAYDPKLVILVDDGKGGTVWVSLFTWYE